MKTCNVCGEIKPLLDYYPTRFKSKEFPDKIYYHGKCKSCFIKTKQIDVERLLYTVHMGMPVKLGASASQYDRRLWRPISDLRISGKPVSRKVRWTNDEPVYIRICIPVV